MKVFDAEHPSAETCAIDVDFPIELASDRPKNAAKGYEKYPEHNTHSTPVTLRISRELLFDFGIIQLPGSSQFANLVANLASLCLDQLSQFIDGFLMTLSNSS